MGLYPYKAQFPINEAKLKKLIPIASHVNGYNPCFKADLRDAAYKLAGVPLAAAPASLAELVKELEIMTRFKRENKASPLLSSDSGPYFEQDDNAILELLEPQPRRSGIIVLLPIRMYHDQNSGNYKENIIKLLDEGKTVILDLGNANEEMVNYFSRQLSEAVFYHQMEKFTSNALGNHYIQLYFEEVITCSHPMITTSLLRFTADLLRKGLSTTLAWCTRRNLLLPLALISWHKLKTSLLLI